ncbi:MAG: siroheme synthase CysG [Lysobacterales bacterium]
MDYLPIFADLKDRPCLVVGGGEIAARKVRMLGRAANQISVVAPQINGELRQEVADGAVSWIDEAFSADHLDGIVLVIAATDDTQVNAEVAKAARARGCLINVVDQPELCNYLSPAIVDRSPLVVAISSGGAMPVLARRVREWLENLLPTRIGELADAARGARQRIAQKIPELIPRRHLWERIVNRGLLAPDNPAAVIETVLAEKQANNGHIYLVGAGPGDPDLLTLKAAQILQQADVVIYDRLVGPGILERARRDAEFIDVGKKVGHHRFSQAQISQMLVAHARQGKVVCRLKGGDSTLFARAGEELEVARGAGIPVELVPGVTAASGCAAAAGISLTHRDLAHSVVMATAHCQKQLECLDTRGMAKSGQTLVFYMPIRQLSELKSRLLGEGMAADMPCALIENGSRKNQRVVKADLVNLDRAAARAQIQSPALLIIGKVVSLIPAEKITEGIVEAESCEHYQQSVA